MDTMSSIILPSPPPPQNNKKKTQKNTPVEPAIQIYLCKLLWSYWSVQYANNRVKPFGPWQIQLHRYMWRARTQNSLEFFYVPDCKNWQE